MDLWIYWVIADKLYFYRDISHNLCAKRVIFLMIIQNTQEKAEMKVNDKKITKVRADGNKLCIGKEWRP